MSGKREKRIRRTARWDYEWELERWRIKKPPFWRIFRYIKWKKSKPVYDDIEKQIRSTEKAGKRERRLK